MFFFQRILSSVVIFFVSITKNFNSFVRSEIETITFCLLMIFLTFWSIIMDASVHQIRRIQRKNGKIIIRVIHELEKVTFEAIVGKICDDFNVSSVQWQFLKGAENSLFQIFHRIEKVEKAVRSFLYNGYYLGFIDVNSDASYKINALIAEQKLPESSSKSLMPRVLKQCSKRPKKWSEKFLSCPRQKSLAMKRMK